MSQGPTQVFSNSSNSVAYHQQVDWNVGPADIMKLVQIDRICHISDTCRSLTRCEVSFMLDLSSKLQTLNCVEYLAL